MCSFSRQLSGKGWWNVLYICCILKPTHSAMSLLLFPVDCLVGRTRLELKLLENTNCCVCNNVLASCIHILCSQRGGSTKCLSQLASKNFVWFCFGFHSGCKSYSERSLWGRKNQLRMCDLWIHLRSKEWHYNWERKGRVEHLSYERKYYSLPRHDVIFSHDTGKS